MKRRAVIACLLAPFGKPMAQEPDSSLDQVEPFLLQPPTLAPFAIAIQVLHNAPESPMLSVEALGRRVTFTTVEVMDILEGK